MPGIEKYNWCYRLRWLELSNGSIVLGSMTRFHIWWEEGVPFKFVMKAKTILGPDVQRKILWEIDLKRWKNMWNIIFSRIKQLHQSVKVVYCKPFFKNTNFPTLLASFYATYAFDFDFDTKYKILHLIYKKDLSIEIDSDRCIALSMLLRTFPMVYN